MVPRDHRDAVAIGGIAVLSDGSQIGVRLTDMSRQGCKVESDETLRIGAPLVLHAGPLDGVSASVRWSLFGTAGVRFTDGDWTA